MNGKNGKGENQSREKEEMGVAGLEIVRQKRGVRVGAAGNAWQVESGEKKRVQLESVE